MRRVISVHAYSVVPETIQLLIARGYLMTAFRDVSNFIRPYLTFNYTLQGICSIENGSG